MDGDAERVNQKLFQKGGISEIALIGPLRLKKLN